MDVSCQGVSVPEADGEEEMRWGVDVSCQGVSVPEGLKGSAGTSPDGTGTVVLVGTGTSEALAWRFVPLSQSSVPPNPKEKSSDRSVGGWEGFKRIISVSLYVVFQGLVNFSVRCHVHVLRHVKGGIPSPSQKKPSAALPHRPKTTDNCCCFFRHHKKILSVCHQTAEHDISGKTDTEDSHPSPTQTHSAGSRHPTAAKHIPLMSGKKSAARSLLVV